MRILQVTTVKHEEVFFIFEGVFYLWLCGYIETGLYEYIFKGARRTLLGGESHLTDQIHGIHNIWSPPSLSDQSSSSV